MAGELRRFNHYGNLPLEKGGGPKGRRDFQSVRRRDQSGDILSSILLLLLLLSLGAMHIASQQMHLARVNQWHDAAVRTAFALDKALAGLALQPHAFPAGKSPWEGVNTWPTAPPSVWRTSQRAVHLRDAGGVEVHVIMESFDEEVVFYRFNALGAHPSGTLIKKQWVLKCEEGFCVRMSQRVMS